MAMDRAQKAALRDSLAERFEKANGAVVAEYRGLTVAELTELRIKLRAAGAEFKVLKNRVAKKAIEAKSPKTAAILNDLKGPIGLVLINGDFAAATKSLLEFGKERAELFKITAGVMDAKRVSPDELKAISELPSKEVLLGRIVGTLVSPHRGLLNVLNGVPRNLVQVINAIKDKKNA
jgi:large subunit ribosomal protein L10